MRAYLAAMFAATETISVRFRITSECKRLRAGA
jgi:hypothetical protein